MEYGWETPSYKVFAEGYGMQRASMAYFWNHYVADRSDGNNPYCSPLTAEDHAGLPPAFIVCAEFDPVCDDGRRYASKLEAAGVPVKFRLYEGMIHGFIWMSGIMDQSRALLDEIADEVRTAFG
ncbi:MAG: alpha/beta hydrolase [Candidatus Thiodiazotropha lotti]|nr:alpha/beta hydrolase [Candidatus Thiodiazotropha lotti]